MNSKLSQFFAQTAEGKLILNIGNTCVAHTNTVTSDGFTRYEFLVSQGDKALLKFFVNIHAQSQPQTNCDLYNIVLFKLLANNLLNGTLSQWANRNKGIILQIWNTINGRESIAPNLDWSEAVQ